jgi:hypothetical protein
VDSEQDGCAVADVERKHIAVNRSGHMMMQIEE